MKELLSLTNEAKQKITIVLDDNSTVILNLEYRDNMQGWFYSLNYNDFQFNNRRLVTNPNILRSFKNIIPFGITVSSKNKLDPAFIDDFETKNIQIFILDEDDIDIVEELFYDG